LPSGSDWSFVPNQRRAQRAPSGADGWIRPRRWWSGDRGCPSTVSALHRCDPHPGGDPEPSVCVSAVHRGRGRGGSGLMRDRARPAATAGSRPGAQPAGRGARPAECRRPVRAAAVGAGQAADGGSGEAAALRPGHAAARRTGVHPARRDPSRRPPASPAHQGSRPAPARPARRPAHEESLAPRRATPKPETISPGLRVGALGWYWPWIPLTVMRNP